MYQNQLNFGVLEIIGEKANLKSEKRYDKKHKKLVSALFIQRIWRGFQGRLRAKLRKMSLSSIKIQAMVRRRISM
jgi:hypothetical protein